MPWAALAAMAFAFTGSPGCASTNTATELSGVTELTSIVGAPRPERSVGTQGRAELVAGCNGHDVDKLAHRAQRHPHGRRTVRHRVIAELTSLVGAPRPHSTVARECQTVEFPCCDGLDSRKQSIAPNPIHR